MDAIPEHKDAKACRGRPRGFCCEQALDAALKVFWEKGYEGASLDDLTTAMGINRPSLYSAFGNKEALFRKVLDRYQSGPGAFLGQAMKDPTVAGMVRRILVGSVEAATCPDRPTGCLATYSMAACGEEGVRIRTEMIGRREAWVRKMRERFDRAVAAGEIPAGIQGETLARYVATVVQGIGMQAAGGAKREELMRVVELAMAGMGLGAVPAAV